MIRWHAAKHLADSPVAKGNYLVEVVDWSDLKIFTDFRGVCFAFLEIFQYVTVLRYVIRRHRSQIKAEVPLRDAA